MNRLLELSFCYLLRLKSLDIMSLVQFCALCNIETLEKVNKCTIKGLGTINEYLISSGKFKLVKEIQDSYDKGSLYLHNSCRKQIFKEPKTHGE